MAFALFNLCSQSCCPQPTQETHHKIDKYLLGFDIALISTATVIGGLILSGIIPIGLPIGTGSMSHLYYWGVGGGIGLYAFMDIAVYCVKNKNLQSVAKIPVPESSTDHHSAEVSRRLPSTATNHGGRPAVDLQQQRIAAENQRLGQMIAVVSSANITSISGYMNSVVFNSLHLTHNPQVCFGGRPETGEYYWHHAPVKEIFLMTTPFEGIMKEDFRKGLSSKIFKEGYEFSYQMLLAYSMEHVRLYRVPEGSNILPEHASTYKIDEVIGNELATKPNYRIFLTIDREKTLETNQLTFKIVEKDGDAELSFQLITL